nr:MAG TPA: hypothetical protein [Caudoviricetes sp.]DAY20735.1 MAG TPA: hypothetical protein [Caudoviricetes sp.]
MFYKSLKHILEVARELLKFLRALIELILVFF